MCVGWCLMYFRVKIYLIAEYVFFVCVVIHKVLMNKCESVLVS